MIYLQRHFHVKYNFIKSEKMKPFTLLVSFLAFSAALQAQTLDTWSDTWVCDDELGRTVASADGGVERTGIDSTVVIGMFYYVWHGQHGTEVKDNTRLVAANPENPAWGDPGQFHWGGRPVLGYYSGGNPFVVAKHMQMLADAGIDYWFFDVTNGWTYDDNVKVVMAEIDRREALGLKTPKLAYLTNASTANVVTHLYETFYSNPEYDKYWFLWDGKPLLLTNESGFNSLPDSIRNHFTARYSWAWQHGENQWPWLARYPQQVGYTTKDGQRVTEQITVATASAPDGMHKGKSYHDGAEPEVDKYGLSTETPYGRFAEEQWKQAFAVHPPMVMMTQWNEWMAQRFLVNNRNELYLTRPGAEKKIGETYFVDVYNQEFCRDLEPSSEPLIRDNYYLQMVSNVRKYRGVRNIPLPTVSKTIDIDGDFAQWQDVTPDFIDEPGDTKYKKTDIQESQARQRSSNDIVLSRVTKDADSLYFYVKVNNSFFYTDIYTGNYWMTLLLNPDCNYRTGWHGYKYMVRTLKQATSLYRYNEADSTWSTIAKVHCKRSGGEMMLAIGRGDINLTADRDFDFKWIDNIPSSGTDILQFIYDGDVAPNGRFNYRYKGSNLTTCITSGKSGWKEPEIINGTLHYGSTKKGPVSIDIFNTAGQIVKSIRQATASSAYCETLNFPANIYLIKYNIAGRKGTKKVKFN